MLKQAKVYIEGDVIGVGFRAWTKIQAKALGVKGWVKNAEGPERTQRVEALLQAEEDVLNKIVIKLKEGSPVSRVDDVEVIWETPTEIFNSFEIVK